MRVWFDDAEHLVFPSKTREEIGLAIGDNVDVSLDGDTLVLRKFQPKCALCETEYEEMVSLHGKYICQDCRGEITLL